MMKISTSWFSCTNCFSQIPVTESSPKAEASPPGGQETQEQEDNKVEETMQCTLYTYIRNYFSDERDHYDLRTNKYDASYLNNCDQAILDDFQYNA